VNGGKSKSGLWVETLFYPKSQSIETPCRRPSNQTPEKKAIDCSAEDSEASPIVIPREEADAVADRNVFPIAGALLNYSTRIGFGLKISGEGESTGNREDTTGVRTSALSFWSADPKSLIEEPLRLGLGCSREISDVRETQVPRLVQFGSLGLAPQLVDVATDQDLDIDAGLVRHASSVTRKSAELTTRFAPLFRIDIAERFGMMSD
jgi:hypothetical protein